MSRLIVILLALCAALAVPLSRADGEAAPVILVFGDSLSAGYGVPPGQAGSICCEED